MILLDFWVCLYLKALTTDYLTKLLKYKYLIYHLLQELNGLLIKTLESN
jgi:hypothetical protein